VIGFNELSKYNKPIYTFFQETIKLISQVD